MKSNIIRSISFLFLILIVLTACNSGDFTDGDKKVTSEMNNKISNYIVEKYATAYPKSDKQIEVHKIFGTKEENNVISVYMWSYYNCFNKETGTKSQAGHSLPAVIKLKQNEGEYQVIDYTEPKDGSLYQPSLKKMFPKRYLKLAQKGTQNSDELQKEMDNKVENWLAE